MKRHLLRHLAFGMPWGGCYLGGQFNRTMKTQRRNLQSLSDHYFRLFRHASFGLCAGVLFSVAGRAADPVLALVRAHAHNDYEHTRPLLDALEQGFCSIEADVWLVDGELRVAHDLKDAQPGRNLEKLYLDPLNARTKQNGGRVFAGGPPVLLLVDVKSDATNTYRLLRSVLQRYQPMLTRFESDRTVTNAVSVVVSGNRTLEWMSRDRVRLAAYDGRLADLEEGHASPHLIPLISDNWALQFHWRGRAEDGPLPAEERAKLRELVARAHRQGRLMRWWGTADTRVVWQELVEAGVDLINTDDLTGLAGYLRSRR